MPAGVTAVFSPATLAGSGISALTLTVPGGTAVGDASHHSLGLERQRNSYGELYTGGQRGNCGRFAGGFHRGDSGNSTTHDRGNARLGTLGAEWRQWL